MISFNGIGPKPPERETLREFLAGAETIAVVGLSDNPHRPSYEVAAYLQRQGYRIIPINPKLDEVLGEKAYPDLASVPKAIDIVDVFRRSEHVPPVAQAAVDIGARMLWLQEGVRHDEAASQAAAAGLLVIQNACLKIEHFRLLGGD